MGRLDGTPTRALICVSSSPSHASQIVTSLTRFPFRTQVGTHGLIIDFTDPSSGAARSATYLPEIAERERWTRRGTIESLIRKAGYGGVIGEALLRALRVTRYQSSPLTRRYEEFEEARRRNAASAAKRRSGGGASGTQDGALPANGW